MGNLENFISLFNCILNSSLKLLLLLTAEKWFVRLFTLKIIIYSNNNEIMSVHNCIRLCMVCNIIFDLATFKYLVYALAMAPFDPD